MTIDDWLKRSRSKLEAAGIGTARLDALVLLEDVLERDRAWILAHPEYEISPARMQELTNLLNRRTRHEPLAYIRGHTEFYGRDFVITSSVLEPRPESETMIDLLKTLPVFRSQPGVRAKNSPKNVSVADIGTGSGALGITAALELPNASVELLDIDSEALKNAKTNVDKFTLDLPVLKSDLLADVNKDYAVLLCNLPYVPDSFQLNTAAAQEPRIAIFGGSDGLELYRRLFDQLQTYPHKPLYILIEAMPSQHSTLSQIAREAGYTILKTDDFIQVLQQQK